ncbi:ankyrin repeat domain-containing protein [Pseudonocardia sp. MH-G8]|uniref:ankyrin repeat domain-containing protein n=1 Tax=Pseudonocardia sp. MH-G8 TaxID=1854588 RepID=UPI001E614F8B|nr:ankyrin repeat domain-containing protein [Pseudonocardia sp. MH-G8]
MPVLPERPSLPHLRKQAKALRRAHALPLHLAQHELARSYGFASWPRLVRHVESIGLQGVERALVLADPASLAPLLSADPAAATAPVAGLPPLLVLLRRATGAPADVRRCAELLLDAGADAGNRTAEDGGDWYRSALFEAVERHDLALARLLVARGATPDEDAFYHACEQADLGFLDLLHRPGFERLVLHALDFEDAARLGWFLDRGVDLDALGALHWAVGRGRGVPILEMLVDAGAGVDRPHPRTGERPLAVAARCGHLAAHDLLAARGATAELDPVARAVLAVARGESAQLPAAPPPLPGVPGDDPGWLLGQFAQLGRTEVVRALLDAGAAVDTRGWSGFTPLDQAAMHGRTEVVRLLVERGADLADRAFDDEGPTPLDCAVWGARDNRAGDGDYAGTVALLLAAGAPTTHEPPTGDAEIDALLTRP